jgi:hypothetical protein
MILKKKYLEKERIQKVWYDSSMIVYSEMKENELENIGDLTITFKNGSTYVYMDVSFEDYLVFIGGGTDASQGKTLNKIIKGKYDYKRIEDRNVQELLTEMNQKEENNILDTYFISGHRDLTENEFEYYYIPLIQEALSENPNAKFVVGDFDGCDIMAQNYLVNIIDDIANITVYCVGETPRNINPNIIYIKNGFADDREKDIAMTNASFKDIALVRNPKIWSGTGENILRRNIFKN